MFYTRYTEETNEKKKKTERKNQIEIEFIRKVKNLSRKNQLNMIFMHISKDYGDFFQMNRKFIDRIFWTINDGIFQFHRISSRCSLALGI